LLSRKTDLKLLPFLACCIIERYKNVTILPRIFEQFKLFIYKKPDIKVIRSLINSFFSIVVKFASNYSILPDLLLNLPSIKPE